MNTAIYALTGDPLTRGHINIVERALRVFDKVLVAIGMNDAKKTLFSLKEREDMARAILYSYGDRIEVKSFEGMLVDFAYENNIRTLIRGVRSSSDFDYERLLNDVNHYQGLGVDTFVLITDPKLSHVSSSAAKSIILNSGKNILDYVPLYAKRKLEEKMTGQYRIGITGEIASGKSYISSQFQKFRDRVEVHTINLDEIGRYILSVGDEPQFKKIRQDVGTRFCLKSFSNIEDIKKLSSIIFENAEALEDFNKIMFEPMSLQIRKSLRNLKGLVIIESALFVELKFMDIVNNNIILVNVNRDEQIFRMKKRGYDDEMIKNRLKAQWTFKEKLFSIQDTELFYGGSHWIIDNNCSTLGPIDYINQIIQDVFTFFNF